MKNVRIQVATHPQDLEGLPVGSAILTKDRKVLELDQVETVSTRADAGSRYWIQPGTLEPLQPSQIRLPAYILPARKGQ